MSLTTVDGKLVNPATGALTGARVTFTLVDYNDRDVIGFDTADNLEAIDTLIVTPAADGTWSAQLVPNASIQLPDQQTQTAYRVVESSAGASSTYWIVVTAISPSWVGDLRTALVGPAAPAQVPGTWCSVTDVLTYTGHDVTQQDVTTAQTILEGHIHRVWRPTDAQRRDYYWLTRAIAFQALYVNANPQLLTMMEVAAISQDGIGITFRPGTNTLPLVSPVARKILDAMFRGSNNSIRLNSAFQKNRLVRAGTGTGGSAPWTPL